MSELALNRSIKSTTYRVKPDEVWAQRAFVYRLALSILLSVEAAEDVTQDVLVRALKVREPIHELRAFLRTATVRMALNHLRKKGDSNLEESLMAKPVELDAKLQIEQTMRQLSSESRTILVLSYFEALSYSEIASELEIPEGTVASRLNTARSAFRKLWGNENE